MDNNLDVLIAGNLYGSIFETSRNDAAYGLFIKAGIFLVLWVGM